MNKKDLVVHVANDVGLPMTKVGPVVDAVVQRIAIALQSGDEVRIQGLGTFSVKETAERQGRNPATGEAITVPAGKKVKFKPAKGLV